MSLNAQGLKTALANTGASPGATIAACAAAWADAIVNYATSLTPPSTTVAAAKATLQTALASAFAQSSAATAMETAMRSFATSVGAGMAPAFVAVPPPGQIGFATQFSGPFPATHTDAGNQLGTRIDTWMRTGTATPSAGGSPVPWS